jgi:hypothetical protein
MTIGVLMAWQDARWLDAIPRPYWLITLIAMAAAAARVSTPSFS